MYFCKRVELIRYLITCEEINILVIMTAETKCINLDIPDARQTHLDRSLWFVFVVPTCNYRISRLSESPLIGLTETIITKEN